VKRVILTLIVVISAIAIGFRVLGATNRETSAPAIVVPLPLPGLQGRQFAPAATYQAFSTRSLHSARMLAVPVIDGNLTDWPDGERIELNRNTAFSYMGGIAGLADLSAIIRSGWDENMLYFAIQVIDDYLVTDSSDVWRDDGVEIGLDGLYDKYAWGLDDHQYTTVADGRIADRTVPTTDIDAAVRITEVGYDIEVAIPMSQLLPTGIPISGTVMGFTIGLHDDDDGGNWDAYLIWEGTSTGNLPEQFGSLIFTERLEDRIVVLEAKLAQLEQRIKELLDILSEFEQVTPP